MFKNIEWTNTGKIKSITFEASAINKHNLVFDYDAMGNRVSKKEYDLSGAFLSATFYVRDAQGNTLAVYDYDETTPGSGQMQFSCSERSIYGSSRLGVYKSTTALGNSIPIWLGVAPLGNYPAIAHSRTTGQKQFELSNHLGNVLAVVSDYKKPLIDPQGYAGRYQAEVLSAQDYYPFGWQMPERTFTSVGGDYRFGFNGQEKDDEIAGEGNSNTAEFWQYDTRLGIRWNLDPKPNASYSNYSVFSNNPIFYIDPLGDTVRTTEAFENNKSKMRAYNLWSKSEAGQKFLKDYGVGGPYEKASVVFDVGGDDDWGSTSVWGVDSKGNAREIASVDWQENQEGEDRVFEPQRNYGLVKGEYLRFVLRFGEDGNDNDDDESNFKVA